MNRNPLRIPEMLDLVQIIWEKNPDLRFSQILYSVVKEGEDIYYIEDDVIYLRLCMRYEL